ncbi:MAG: sodium:proton exchanger [Ponticaulis sp.]|nr:sodium:proton exchanger [Ponticaulis sp.]|tara:strand:- start:30816 stop:32729 length:1914 start_codon:yes stop_codon:yes gene_type:complete
MATPAETAAFLTPVEAVALIGVLGMGAQWLAWRLQLPAIVLMSVAGLIVGPVSTLILPHPLLEPGESFGDLLRPIVSLAVAIILFEGGMALKFSDLRESGAVVRRLVFVGAPVAWILGTIVCYYFTGLGLGTAILFAGILIVTGPTVIMPLLRQSKLGGRVGKALKWEGIVNDPVGALFAVAAFEVFRVLASEQSAVSILVWIAFAVLFGTVIGILAGIGLSRAFRNAWVPEFLKAPVILISVLACYALAEAVEHEIGLVAVTAFGMALGNSKFASLQDMRRFKENIAVILISGVFVILTADLTVETIVSAFTWETAFFLLGMLFLVRPLTVFIATWGELSWRESLLIGWIAPRGIVAVAVSGFFAGRLVSLQSETGSSLFAGAEQITALAFAIVFVTVIAHGFTIGPLARYLKLARSKPAGVLLVGANAWSTGLAKTLQDADVEVVMADTDLRRLRPAREAGISAFTGEVLSEAAEHRLDHALFSTVISVSANDYYNALVCRHFGPELGRDRTFQLSSTDKDGDSLGVPTATRGRTLMRAGRGYDSLIRDHYRKWQFHKTELTEKYDMEKFREDRPEADLIAEIRPDGTIQFLGPERPPKGELGSRIISFGPEVSPKPTPEPSSGQPPADPPLPTA